ncbi:hypothetical protein KIPB_009873, partial [Kipferlia bialata]
KDTSVRSDPKRVCLLLTLLSDGTLREEPIQGCLVPVTVQDIQATCVGREVYVLGGTTTTATILGARDTPNPNIYAYSLETNEWRVVAQTSEWHLSLMRPVLSFSLRDCLYICSRVYGASRRSSMVKYTPSTGAWDSIAIPEGLCLGFPSAVVVDDTVHITGGDVYNHMVYREGEGEGGWTKVDREANPCYRASTLIPLQRAFMEMRWHNEGGGVQSPHPYLYNCVSSEWEECRIVKTEERDRDTDGGTHTGKQDRERDTKRWQYPELSCSLGDCTVITSSGVARPSFEIVDIGIADCSE